MNNVSVTVQEIDVFTASTNQYNVPLIPTLGSIEDVDVSNLSNGSVLVYKTSNNKWNATTILDLQSVDCGEY